MLEFSFVSMCGSEKNRFKIKTVGMYGSTDRIKRLNKNFVNVQFLFI